MPGTLTVHPKVLDVQVEWGSRSMSILGLTRDLPFVGIKVIDAVFSDDVEVDSLSLNLKNQLFPSQTYVVKSFEYDPKTYTARWTLFQPIDGDRPLLTLDSDGATTDGHNGIRVNPDIYIRPFFRQFAVLPGDFNGDGVVNSQDLVGVRNQINGTGDPKLFGWADFDGNNTVNLDDYGLIRKRIGRHL